MKKQILLLTAVVLSTIAFAQVQPWFGVRAGLSSSSIQGDAMTNLKNILDFTDGMITTGSRTGFFAGTYASIPLSGAFSVEPALYYTQKGQELQGELAVKGTEFLSADAKAKLNTHYIDLPVLIKADLGGFHVFAGPQFSYLAKADLQTTAGVLGINLLNKRMDATDQFNRWDAGLTGGIGYGFANGVNLTAAYDHGLSKIDAGRNVNSYNRSFKIGIGVSF